MFILTNGLSALHALADVHLHLGRAPLRRRGLNLQSNKSTEYFYVVQLPLRSLFRPPMVVVYRAGAATKYWCQFVYIRG